MCKHTTTVPFWQSLNSKKLHGIPAAVAREATMDALVELITALRD